MAIATRRVSTRSQPARSLLDPRAPSPDPSPRCNSLTRTRIWISRSSTPIARNESSRAREPASKTIIAIGISADTSAACVDLAAEFEGVHAAVGMQPNYIAEAQPGDWDRIVAMLEQPGVVAIGETGLDRHWDFTPFDVQQDYFDRHMRLSQERGLPFVVHMRDCDEDILVMLRDAHARGPLTGVMHSFTGSRAMADECLAMGLYISFAGMVTYKKSDELRAVAADRAGRPHPHRDRQPVSIAGAGPQNQAERAGPRASHGRLPGRGSRRNARSVRAQTTANAERLFLHHVSVAACRVRAVALRRACCVSARGRGPYRVRIRGARRAIDSAELVDWLVPVRWHGRLIRGD